MIKAIIFDFGQTLVDSAEGFKFAEKIAKEKIYLNLSLNLNGDPWDNFLTQYRQIRKQYHSESIFSRPAIWQAVYDHFQCKSDSLMLEKMETEYWDQVKSRTRPFPETINVLEKLSTQFRLGIITNTQGQRTSENHRISLFPKIEKFFETVIIAGESNIPAKPHALPFDLCLKGMKLKSDEAVYVGDDFQKDIFGAGHAGLHPVWLKHHLVKRSWPDPAPSSHYQIITDLNELSELIKRRFG